MTSSLMNRYYKGSAIEYDEQNAVKNGKTKIRNLFYCQNNSHYKQTVLYYILLIGHIESNPGPNIVSGKPNLKNGSLKIAHINACSLLPKIDLIELEMSNNDIILVSETHLSQDIDNEDIQLRGFQNPIRVDRNRHGGGVAIFAKPNIYICEKPEFHTSEIEILWLEVIINRVVKPKIEMLINHPIIV